MDTLRVVARTSEGVVRVVASGEIDFATVDQFNQAFTEAFSTPAKELELDLAEATFIDSIGINALIRARKVATDAGRGFRIVQASRHVRSALTLMGLAEYMD